MIIQEQPEHSLLAGLARWERRLVSRPSTEKNKTRRLVQLVSPAGKVFTSSSSLLSFLQQNRGQIGGSLSEDWVREEIRQLFRLREEERHRRRRGGAKLAKAKVSPTTWSELNCDNKEAPDYRQLLPSQPLSPGELSHVERIITLEEEEEEFMVNQDLEDLDDIDFPRLEEEKIICDVPLTFRRD